jgi:predicted dehydrogenase/nucleoside-diphosphate-sugar epimerase
VGCTEGPISSEAPVRVAVVGCGAVAELHLLALQVVEDAEATAVFDVDPARAGRLRSQWCPSARIARSLAEVAEMADLAIVATPNVAHEDTSCELLERGAHVLCEKPLAPTAGAAARMIETAEARGRLLTAGHVRRFAPQRILLREALESGLLGAVTAVRVWECVAWQWRQASFDRSASGGGVLIDTGPHVLDLVMDLLGSLELVDYTDDSAGGVEAYAFARLVSRIDGRTVPVELRLSRGEWGVSFTRIECGQGSVVLEPHLADTVGLTLRGAGGPLKTILRRAGPNPYVSQLRNVIAAVKGREALTVSAEEALEGLRLLSECYRTRRPLFAGWRESHHDIDVADGLAAGRVLVTGATGRIGSRLVEMWAESGRLAQLRCLVRSYRSAARLMRHPADVVEGDLRDPTTARRAIEGCDAVIHLGAGEDPPLETRHLAREALAKGVHRFVHMSTAVVYGLGLPRAIEARQEDTPLSRTGEVYADGKAKAERLLEHLTRRGLRTVILRPQVVYGPEMRWSAELIRLLVEGKLSVLAHGGTCNVIFVDDLVRAIGLALAADCPPGRPFFITDGQPRTWADYIDAHARLAGLTAPRSHRRREDGRAGLGTAWRDTVKLVGPLMGTAEFRTLLTEGPLLRATVFRAYLALRDRVGAIRMLAAAARRARTEAAAGGTPRFDPHWGQLQLSEARLSSQRAEKELGFTSKIDFDEGLRRTGLWFAAVGLAPEGQIGRER